MTTTAATAVLPTDYTGEVIDYSPGSNEGRKVRRLLADLDRAKVARAKAQERVAKLETELKVMTQGREVVQVDGGTVYTWRIVDSTKIDTPALKLHLGASYRDFLKTTLTRRFEITKTS